MITVQKIILTPTFQGQVHIESSRSALYEMQVGEEIMQPLKFSFFNLSKIANVKIE